MPRRIIRLAAIVLALLILAAPVVGVYLFLHNRAPAATTTSDVDVTGDVEEKAQGLERMLLGFYLGIRDGDVRRPASSDPSPVIFTVQPGDNAEAIGRKLKTAGLILDPGLFRQLAKYQGVGENLQAGLYELRADMTMEEILAILQHGRPSEIIVRVREGWRMEQVALALSQNGLPSYDDLLKAMQADAYDYAILGDRPSGTTIEGYLFPDTYRMDQRWSAHDVVDLLLQTMDARFTPAMRQQATAAGLSVHQVLTLASLIEREAVTAQDRPLIASVLLNRIAQNMPLQVDATVQYALGYDKAKQRWWPIVTVEQYNSVKSPYNTYVNRGLPPGPICSPGLASINAALQPAKTDYLFYVAKGDGSHAFAKTYEEHLQNVKKYQK